MHRDALSPVYQNPFSATHPKAGLARCGTGVSHRLTGWAHILTSILVLLIGAMNRSY